MNADPFFPTDSIFSGSSIVPLRDVQHIEWRGSNIMVIMKSTVYAFEQDEWMNPVFFAEEEAERFVAAWRVYRLEQEQREHHPLNSFTPNQQQ